MRIEDNFSFILYYTFCLLWLILLIYLPLLIILNIVKKQLKAKRQLRVDQILNEKSAVPALKGRHIQQISEPVYGTESKHQRQKINKLAKRKLKESPQPSPKKAKNKQAYDVWAVEGSIEISLLYMCRCLLRML